MNALCIYHSVSAIISYGQSGFISTPHFPPATNYLEGNTSHRITSKIYQCVSLKDKES